MGRAHVPRSVGAALALGVVLLVAAEGPTTPLTPSPTRSEEADLSDVATRCRVDQATRAQVVACQVDELPPGQEVRMSVEAEPSGASERSVWTGSATAGPGGRASVQAGLPCEVAGPARVRLAADATGSYRHRQEVELAGRCRPAWMPTGSAVVRLVGVVVVLATVALVLRERRRQQAVAREAARARGRRVRRSGRLPVSRAPGRPGRRGSPTRRR